MKEWIKNIDGENDESKLSKDRVRVNVMLIAEKKIIENWHRRTDVETNHKFPCRFGDIHFRLCFFRQWAYIPWGWDKLPQKKCFSQFLILIIKWQVSVQWSENQYKILKIYSKIDFLIFHFIVTLGSAYKKEKLVSVHSCLISDQKWL
jgi:hypothetical protein